MSKQPLPSKLIADIKHRLKQIQQKAAQATKKVGYAHEVISAGEPYWQALDDPFKSGQVDEVLASGYDVLQSLHRQVEATDLQSSELLGQVEGIMSNTSMYAGVTAATVSFSGLTLDFDSEHLRKLSYSFERHDEYQRKLEALDSALSRTFGGIRDAYFGASSDSLRQALFQARQTVDHFFNALIPDDMEVMQQSWWSPDDPKKPQVISRPQRIRYAAEKHVRDRNQREVLIQGARHMNKVYDALQMLHTRGTLDEARAKDVLFEMLSLIRTWVDSIFS